MFTRYSTDKALRLGILLSTMLWATANAAAYTLINCPANAYEIQHLDNQVSENWASQQPNGGDWCDSSAFDPLSSNPAINEGKMGMRGIGTDCPTSSNKNPQLSYEKLVITPGRYPGEAQILCVYTIHDSAVCDINCGNNTITNETVLRTFIEVSQRDCHILSNSR